MTNEKAALSKQRGVHLARRRTLLVQLALLAGHCTLTSPVSNARAMVPRHPSIRPKALLTPITSDGGYPQSIRGI